MKIRFFIDVEMEDDMKTAMMLHIDLQAAVADVVIERHLKTDGLQAVRLQPTCKGGVKREKGSDV